MYQINIKHKKLTQLICIPRKTYLDICNCWVEFGAQPSPLVRDYHRFVNSQPFSRKKINKSELLSRYTALVKDSSKATHKAWTKMNANAMRAMALHIASLSPNIETTGLRYRQKKPPERKIRMPTKPSPATKKKAAAAKKKANAKRKVQRGGGITDQARRN